MSGGVGPTGDISLPKEEVAPSSSSHDEGQAFQNLSLKHPKKSGKGFLSFRQLNSLAIMIVLAASGMVSLEDFALVVFSFIYFYFLSVVAFPTHSPSQEQPVFNQKSKILNLYVLFAGIIGLLLPILYILEGILEGDKEGIKAAVPHVFLLASQVFMEGVSVSDRFSLPIRVFVPVFYNSSRLFSLFDWFKDEMLKVGEGRYAASARRLYVGRALAVVNLGFWCFNLFGFLLPVYLPRAFKRYYGVDVEGSSSKKE